MEKSASGIWINFEGLSGSGKTTLAKMVLDWLVKQNMVAILNPEPTKHTVFGIAIRALIEGKRVNDATLHDLQKRSKLLLQNAVHDRNGRSSFCRKLVEVIAKITLNHELIELDRQILFLADGLLDLEEIVLPAMRKGIWIVQDRWRFSTDAYGASHGVPIAKLETWQKRAVGGEYYFNARPNLTFFIEVSPAIAFERLKKSGKVIDRYETLENLRSVDAHYREAFLFRNREFRNAGRPGDEIVFVRGEHTPEEVFEEICRHITDRWFQV